MDFASPDILRDASSAKLTTACTAEHLPSQTGFIPLAWPLAQVLIGRVFSFFHCKRDHLRLGVTDKASRNGEWKPNALWGPLASPRFLSKIFLQPLSPPPTPTPSTNTHPAPFKDQPFCRERERLGKARTSSKPDWKCYLLVQRGQRKPERPILAAPRIDPSRSVLQRRPSSPQMRTLTLGGGKR